MDKRTVKDLLLEWGMLSEEDEHWYHGTPKKFDKFQAKPSRGMQLGFPAVHFSKDPNYSKDYAEKSSKQGRIIKAKLNVKNTLNAHVHPDIGSKEHEFMRDIYKGTPHAAHFKKVEQASAEHPGTDNHPKGKLFITPQHAIDNVSPAKALKTLHKHGYDSIRYTAQNITHGAPGYGYYSKGKSAEAMAVLNPDHIEVVDHNHKLEELKSYFASLLVESEDDFHDDIYYHGTDAPHFEKFKTPAYFTKDYEAALDRAKTRKNGPERVIAVKLHKSIESKPWADSEQAVVHNPDHIKILDHNYKKKLSESQEEFPQHWISPEGKEHPLKYEVGGKSFFKDHDSSAYEHAKAHNVKYNEDEETAANALYRHGWASTGHADGANATGNHLHDPNHPTTKTIRKIVASHHGNEFELHNPKTEQLHRINPELYAKHGVLRHPETNQLIDFNGEGE